LIVFIFEIDPLLLHNIHGLDIK